MHPRHPFINRQPRGGVHAGGQLLRARAALARIVNVFTAAQGLLLASAGEARRNGLQGGGAGSTTAEFRRGAIRVLGGLLDGGLVPIGSTRSNCPLWPRASAFDLMWRSAMKGVGVPHHSHPAPRLGRGSVLGGSAVLALVLTFPLPFGVLPLAALVLPVASAAAAAASAKALLVHGRAVGPRLLLEPLWDH